MAQRIAFLGPAGTFSEDALLSAAANADIEPQPRPSVYAAIRAVVEGEADRALVPFENSIEGAVRSTLDTLAFEAAGVAIAGEHDHAIRHSLIARTELPWTGSRSSCRIRRRARSARGSSARSFPGATVRAAASTADAVRMVAASDEPWAALGAASAARIYGCVVLRDGVEDDPDNVTRFVWIAPEGTEPDR